MPKLTPTDHIIAHCAARGLPAPVREWPLVAWRAWRFDLAWPSALLALEIQGGSFAGKPCPVCKRRPGGRHNSAAALRDEYEKLAHAAILGWRVLLLMPEQVKPETGLAWIEQALRQGK